MRLSCPAATAIAALVLGLLTATPAHASARTKVIAGTGSEGFSGDGGPATKAQLFSPTGVARADDGTIYVSDTGNNRVRKIAPDGTMTTVAGCSHGPRPSSNGSTATRTVLGTPGNLALGPHGTLYIADPLLKQVLELDTDGTLSVVAGTGQEGSSGDGGPATRATLTEPRGLAVSDDGTVYIGDVGTHTVRAVSSQGVITTVAGNGDPALRRAKGSATAVAVPYPNMLSVDPSGTLWIVDAGVLQRLHHATVSMVTTQGVATLKHAVKWQLAAAGDWRRISPSPLAGVVAVQATAHGVFALSGSPAAMIKLRSDHSAAVVAKTGSHDHLLNGQFAVSGRHAYVADSARNRVVRVTLASGADVNKASRRWSRWWLLVAGGGAVAVALIVVGAVVMRCRRAQ